VLLTRRRPTDEPVPAMFTRIGYCEQHASAIRLEDLLSPEGMTKLTKFMRESGLPTPDKRLTTLGWNQCKIDDDQPRTEHGKVEDDSLPF
jgi:hypothetical protein